MTTLTPKYPLYSQPLRLCVHLGVEPFRHLMGGKIAEITTLGGISAPGDIKAQVLKVMKKHHISHACIRSWVCKDITRGCNEKDFSPFPVKVLLHPDACYVFYFVGKKIEHVFIGMWLNT